MNKLIITLLLTLGLASGCATQQPVVDIPVSQRCKVEVPAESVLHYNPGTYEDVFSIVRDLKGDWLVLTSDNEVLRAALIGCTKP
jgi:hypothetical protein